MTNSRNSVQRAGIEPIFQRQMQDQFAQKLLVRLGQPEHLRRAERRLIVAPASEPETTTTSPTLSGRGNAE